MHNDVPCTGINRILIVAIIAVLIASLSCQLYYAHRNKVMAEAISKSTNPIATACALDSISSTQNASAVCLLIASRSN